VTITGIHCDGCGQWVSGDATRGAKCEYTPLNEFGPEELKWVCRKCVEKEEAALLRH
jgi:hypothetical protein